MRGKKVMLQILLYIALVLSLVVPASVVGASRAVRLPDNHAIGCSVAGSSAAALPMALNTPEGNVNPMVTAGNGYIVGLKSDGTVVAVGDNDWGQCDVDSWTDITQVAAGAWHTVGLKTDGTVVAVGRNYEGQRNVGGCCHTVGLKSDGTVVAVGKNTSRQCDVDSWTDIVQVSAAIITR